MATAITLPDVRPAPQEDVIAPMLAGAALVSGGPAPPEPKNSH